MIYKLFILIAVLILPHFIFGSLHLNGTFTPVYLLLCLIPLFLGHFSFKWIKSYLYIILFFFSILGILNSHWNVKICVSFLLVIIYLGNSKFWRNLFHQSFDISIISRAIRCAYLIILVFNSIYDVKAFNYYRFNNSFFPFTEPSHFFLTFCPWIIPRNIGKGDFFDIFIVIITLIAGFVNDSLVAIIIGIITLFFSFPKFSAVLIIFGSSFFVEKLLSNKYFSDRVLLNSSNLTSAVWLLGWNEMASNLYNTSFLGYGFQALGFSGHSSAFASDVLLVFREFDSINLLDGGFLSVKLVSEFGIFGIMFIFVMIRNIISWGYFGLLAALILELFFRGIGYSTITFVIALTFAINSGNNVFQEKVKQ